MLRQGAELASHVERAERSLKQPGLPAADVTRQFQELEHVYEYMPTLAHLRLSVNT